MARKSLDDILDGNDEPEVMAEPQPEQTEERPRDESGRFAPKGVEPQQEEPVAEAVPPTADRLPKDVYEPLKAVRDENNALKEQLETLAKQIQANQQPPAPPPSIWEDDQAWQQHFGGQVVSQAVQQATYQSKLANGLLEHKTTTVHRSDGSEKTATQVRVTPKGLTRLAMEFQPHLSLVQ